MIVVNWVIPRRNVLTLMMIYDPRKFDAKSSLIVNKLSLVTNSKNLFLRTEVRVGEVDLNKVKNCDSCEPAVDHQIEKALVHLNFTKPTRGFNIALLKLKKRVKLTNHVKTVCLPIEKKYQLDDAEAVNMTSLKFPRNSDNQNNLNRLTKADSHSVPLEKCNTRNFPSESLKDGQICSRGYEDEGAYKGKKFND